MWWSAAPLLLAAAAGAAVTTSPTMALTALGAAAALVLLALRPQASLPATVLLLWTALPAAVPQDFQVAGLTVATFEPTLAVALLYSLPRIPWRAIQAACAFGLLLLAAAVAGLARQHPVGAILGDLRPVLDMVLASVVAATWARTGLASVAVRAVGASLWISAGFLIVASTTGFDVQGRSEVASLQYQTEGATRLLSPATYLALAVLCASLALLVARLAASRAVLPFLVPALIIVFLAFSRSSLLAVVVALGVCVLSRRDVSTGVRLVGVGLVAGAVLAFGSLAFTVLPGGGFIREQTSAFSERVLGGVSSESRAVDPSALFRQEEIRRLDVAIRERPLFGHGLGAAYKPPRGERGSFEATTAPYYAHNFYLWIWFKAGAVGLASFLLFALLPVLRWLRRGGGDGTEIALGAAAAALLAISVVVPVPLGYVSAMALGVCLGGLLSPTARASSPRPVVRIPEQVQG